MDHKREHVGTVRRRIVVTGPAGDRHGAHGAPEYVPLQLARVVTAYRNLAEAARDMLDSDTRAELAAYFDAAEAAHADAVAAGVLEE